MFDDFKSNAMGKDLQKYVNEELYPELQDKLIDDIKYFYTAYLKDEKIDFKCEYDFNCLLELKSYIRSGMQGSDIYTVYLESKCSLKSYMIDELSLVDLRRLLIKIGKLIYKKYYNYEVN